MTQEVYCPEAQLSVGEWFSGFRVLRVEKINDIRVTAYEIEHDKTGAKIIHLHCNDKKIFLPLVFVHLQKTRQGFRILSNIPYLQVRINTL